MGCACLLLVQWCHAQQLLCCRVLQGARRKANTVLPYTGRPLVQSSGIYGEASAAVNCCPGTCRCTLLFGSIDGDVALLTVFCPALLAAGLLCCEGLCALAHVWLAGAAWGVVGNGVCL